MFDFDGVGTRLDFRIPCSLTLFYIRKSQLDRGVFSCWAAFSCPVALLRSELTSVPFSITWPDLPKAEVAL